MAHAVELLLFYIAVSQCKDEKINIISYFKINSTVKSPVTIQNVAENKISREEPTTEIDISSYKFILKQYKMQCKWKYRNQDLKFFTQAPTN